MYIGHTPYIRGAVADFTKFSRFLSRCCQVAYFRPQIYFQKIPKIRATGLYFRPRMDDTVGVGFNERLKITGEEDDQNNEYLWQVSGDDADE